MRKGWTTYWNTTPRAFSVWPGLRGAAEHAAPRRPAILSFLSQDLKMCLNKAKEKAWKNFFSVLGAQRQKCWQRGKNFFSEMEKYFSGNEISSGKSCGVQQRLCAVFLCMRGRMGNDCCFFTRSTRADKFVKNVCKNTTTQMQNCIARKRFVF